MKLDGSHPGASVPVTATTTFLTCTPTLALGLVMSIATMPAGPPGRSLSVLSVAVTVTGDVQPVVHVDSVDVVVPVADNIQAAEAPPIIKTEMPAAIITATFLRCGNAWNRFRGDGRLLCNPKLIFISLSRGQTMPRYSPDTFCRSIVRRVTTVRHGRRVVPSKTARTSNVLKAFVPTARLEKPNQNPLEPGCRVCPFWAIQ
jgi:hypothetical protein